MFHQSFGNQICHNFSREIRRQICHEIQVQFARKICREIRRQFRHQICPIDFALPYIFFNEALICALRLCLISQVCQKLAIKSSVMFHCEFHRKIRHDIHYKSAVRICRQVCHKFRQQFCELISHCHHYKSAVRICRQVCHKFRQQF